MMWLLFVCMFDDGSFRKTLEAIEIRGEVIQSTPEPPAVITEQDADEAAGGIVITLTKPVAAAPQMVTVTERYMISEPWCPACLQQKPAHLRSGGKVVSIAEAVAMGEPKPSSIPRYFTRTVQRQVAGVTAAYRSQWPPQWTIDGDRQPSRQKYLTHLRGNSNHRGKFWQSYPLESWTREQLAALHDDDHVNRVARIVPQEQQPAEAEVPSTATVGSLAAALSLHLASESGQQADGLTGAFNIDADVPDAVQSILRRLLIDRRVEFGRTGLSASWDGKQPSVTLGNNRVDIKPGLTVTAKKWGINFSATLEGISYDAGFRSVLLELRGVPDLRVRFQ